VGNVALIAGLAGIVVLGAVALFGPQMAAADPQAQRSRRLLSGRNVQGAAHHRRISTTRLGPIRSDAISSPGSCGVRD